MPVGNNMGHIGKLLGFILLGINGVVVLLLLLSAFSPYLNPLDHSIWSSMGLFFPIFALLNLIFLVFWLFFNWKYALLPL